MRKLPTTIPRFQRKKTKSKAFATTVILFLTFALTLGGAYFSIIASQHQDEVLRKVVDTPRNKVRETNRVYDIYGNLIHEFHFGEDRLYVPLDEIPQHTQQAIIAAEDIRFYSHPGYDIKAIIRAAVANLQAGGIAEGGSTITQQLARNVYIHDPFQQSVMRKIDELIIATRLEQDYTKDEILEFYLNVVYFGSGAYGIQSAAKKYFGKSDVSKLTIDESALLAGLISSPSNFSPYVSLDNAVAQRKLVVAKMADAGFITNTQADEINEKLVKLNPYSIQLQAGTSINYFLDYVKEEILLRCDLNFSDIEKGGLDIYTTINQQYQVYADEAIASVLDPAQARGEFGKTSFDKLGVLQPQTSLAAVDVDTGRIVAMVGGRDYKNTQFNRTVALRSPGSSFKIIVYTAALNLGRLSPYSRLVSAPFSLGSWRPREWFSGYFGNISVRYAVEQSSNIAAIKAALMAGLPNVSSMAQRMCGIKNREILAVPSMALGSVEMKPLEMASAGQTLSYLGTHVDAHSVLKVINRKNKKTIYSVNDYLSDMTRQVVDPGIAYDMVDMLKGVVTRGTGTTARVYGVPCAGKTGTTASYRDGWFVGFTPEISAAVYVGSDSKDVDLSYVRNYGSKYSAVIWREFIKKVSQGKKIADWKDPNPRDFVSLRICRETGLIANSTCRFDIIRFRKGLQPTEKCTKNHPKMVKVTICSETGLVSNEYCKDKQSVEFEEGKQPTEVCKLHKKLEETKPTKPDNGGKPTPTPKPKPDDTTPTPTPTPTPDPTPTPTPTPTPDPTPTPTPTPTPDPTPPPPPPPPAKNYYFFVNISPPSSCRVSDVVRCNYSFNYENVGWVSMFANGVSIGVSSSPPWSIIWRPSGSGNFSLLFVLYSKSGSRLAEYSVGYKVYP